MLANNHMTPKAISTFMNCVVTRARLALEALNSTTSPIVISTSANPRSMPSTCWVRYPPNRLIAGFIVFTLVLVAFGRFRHFAQQIVIEHLARDRRGIARAETGVL